MNRLSTFTPGLLAMKKKYLRRKLSFQLPGNFCMDQTQTVFGLSLYKCTTTITPWQFTFFSPVIRKKTTMPLSNSSIRSQPCYQSPFSESTVRYGNLLSSHTSTLGGAYYLPPLEPPEGLCYQGFTLPHKDLDFLSSTSFRQKEQTQKSCLILILILKC